MKDGRRTRGGELRRRQEEDYQEGLENEVIRKRKEEGR